MAAYTLTTAPGAFVWTGLNANLPLARSVSLSQTVTLASTAPLSPHCQQKITFTSTYSNNLPYVNNPTSTIYFVSRFHVVGGDLTTGRYRR